MDKIINRNYFVRSVLCLLLIYCGSLFLSSSTAYAVTDQTEVSRWLPVLWTAFKWSGVFWFVSAVVGFCYVTSPRSSYFGFIPIGIFLCWIITILVAGLFNSFDWIAPWSTIWDAWKLSGIVWLSAALASIFIIPDDTREYPRLDRLLMICWLIFGGWFLTVFVAGLFV